MSTYSKPLLVTGAALSFLVGAMLPLGHLPAPAPLPGAAVFPDAPGPVAVLPLCRTGWACVEEPGRVVCQCPGGAR